MKETQAYLVLKDGTVFLANVFGKSQTTEGEVVFNTALSGYQEVLTDPSYHSQMVVMTYPQIGNYGINPVDFESKKIHLKALIIKELSPIVSNYRAKKSLDQFLKEQGVVGLKDLDTRKLVRHIREKGAMPAKIYVNKLPPKAKLQKELSGLKGLVGQDLVSLVTTKKAYTWQKPFDVSFVKKVYPYSYSQKAKGFKLVAFDFGIKHNILRLLKSHGFQIEVVPANTKAATVLAKKPDAVFLSNGPGDPAALSFIVDEIKQLIEAKIPIFGICLGFQLLALALGAKSYKLKFGHHGTNHPVIDLKTKKVEITSQNHGFAIDKKLPKNLTATHLSLYDQTLEGFEHKTKPVFAVQYHPEAAPGPFDSQYLFERFVEMVVKNKKVKVKV